MSDILQTSRTNLALFADDTTIYTEYRNIEAITVPTFLKSFKYINQFISFISFIIFIIVVK